MPRKCSVCAHRSLGEIDLELARGFASLRNVAERFRVGKFSLFRHGLHHLPKVLAKAAEAEEVARGEHLMGQLLEVKRQTRGILASALVDGERELALKAIARLERQIELEARLRGELEEGATVVNLSISHEWREVRTLIFQALRAHPDARVAVATALQSHVVASAG